MVSKSDWLRGATALAIAAMLAACADESDVATLTIGAVQGRGDTSPLHGQLVVVEGVVTTRFDASLGGFFVQSPEDAEDHDPATSDGLFVSWSAAPAPVQIGQRLRLAGMVTELGDEGRSVTALDMAELQLLGPGAVESTILSAPPDNWEALEGMRLRIEAPLTVGRNDELRRHGSIGVSFGGRLFQPTEQAQPGPAAAVVATDNARRSLVLDDGSEDENPESIAWLVGSAGPLRAGSEIVGAEGVLDQRHGRYRLQQDSAPAQVRPAPRPQPPQIAGDLRVAGLNLLNLFNGDGHGGGFPTPRGARTEAAYRTQQAKLVAVVTALNPDIAALMEVENDGFGPDSALAQFVAALNAANPDGGDWQLINAGQGPGNDAIRVALIYRASRIRPVGHAASLNTGAFAHGSRPPLAQSFRGQHGPAFTVVANHFKSKGSCQEARGDNLDQGDGQGCWNASRSAAAVQLDAWIGTDPTGIGSENVVIIGDLNSYALEDPITILTARGWHDALALAGGAAPYSFAWDGQIGRLDHALVSPSLAPHVRGAAEWHNNADEEVGQGYPDGEPGPWRASDHDPLLIGLEFGPGHR